MEGKTSRIEVRLTDLWLILKRCWWMMLIALVIVFLGMYIFTNATHEDEYTATAVVWALGNNGGSSTGASTSTSDVSIGTQLINDYKQLLVTDSFLEEVIKEQHLQIKPAKLRSMIHVEHEDETRVMYVSVTTTDKEGAKEIVDTLVDVFCRRVNENADSERGQELIKPWGRASEPTAPSNPVSALKIALIAFLCAVAVYAVYFVLYILDDKISTAEDVQKHLGVSMLGMIPNRQDVMRRKRGKGGYGGYYYDSGAPASSAGQQSAGKGRNE